MAEFSSSHAAAAPFCSTMAKSSFGARPLRLMVETNESMSAVLVAVPPCRRPERDAPNGSAPSTPSMISAWHRGVTSLSDAGLGKCSGWVQRTLLAKPWKVLTWILYASRPMSSMRRLRMASAPASV